MGSPTSLSLHLPASRRMILNLSAGHCDRLSRDRARPLAAKPKHGVGDFRRTDQAALRIMTRKLCKCLLAIAARRSHDVFNALRNKIGIRKAWTYGIYSHARA